MKIFEIRNKSDIYAYLFVSDNYNYCYIEINERALDQPIFFHMFLEKGIKTIDNEWTRKWINERVIPVNRQNIKDILKDNGMLYYDEVLMLIKVKGKSSMDDNYLNEIKYEKICENVLKRLEHKIIDFMYDDLKLIIFFKTNVTKIYNIDDLKINEDNKPFLSPLGNEIIFNTKIRFSYDYLYEKGNDLDFSYNALINYLKDNLYSSNMFSEELNVTRQNVNYLKKTRKLNEVISGIYLKNDVLTSSDK